MYFSTMGTAILAGFGTVGAAPAARPDLTPIGEPVIAPVKGGIHKDSTSAATPAVNMTQTPPRLTYLFSATLVLGPALPPNVSVACVCEAQSLTGRLEGPALNATISVGRATPMLMNNGMVATVDITISGMTDDNYTVFATQVGVGPNSAQNSLLSLEVGGPYAYLTDLFILAHIARDDATRSVRLDAYNVV